MRKHESHTMRGPLDRRPSIAGGLEERREALHLAQVEVAADRRCAWPPTLTLLANSAPQRASQTLALGDVATGSRRKVTEAS
jgi:hypothetical protein